MAAERKSGRALRSRSRCARLPRMVHPIVRWRRANRITRYRLAKAAGIPHSTMRDIELGAMPSAATLYRLLAGAAQLAGGMTASEVRIEDWGPPKRRKQLARVRKRSNA